MRIPEIRRAEIGRRGGGRHPDPVTLTHNPPKPLHIGLAAKKQFFSLRIVKPDSMQQLCKIRCGKRLRCPARTRTGNRRKMQIPPIAEICHHIHVNTCLKMLGTGIEPALLSEPEPKSGASANSATRAGNEPILTQLIFLDTPAITNANCGKHAPGARSAHRQVATIIAA